MLLLIFGFFYQSYEEVRNIAPVQVAVERMSGPDTHEVPEESDRD